MTTAVTNIDFTLSFFNTAENKKKEITLAYFPAGPRKHNPHIEQMQRAMCYLGQNKFLHYDPIKGEVSLGINKGDIPLQSVFNDRGERNFRLILATYVRCVFDMYP